MRASFQVVEKDGKLANRGQEDEKAVTIKIDMEKLAKKIMREAGPAKHIKVNFSISGKDSWIQRTVEEGAHVNGKPLKFSVMMDCGDIIVAPKKLRVKKLPENLSNGHNGSQDFSNDVPDIDVREYSSRHFLYLIKKLYKKTYGHSSVEFDTTPKGRLLLKLRRDLIDIFHSIKFDNRLIVDYLNWVFEEKSDKLVLSLGLITSRAIIAEFVAKKNMAKSSFSKSKHYSFK